MGAAQGKASDVEEQPPEAGVRVTQTLLKQLAGSPQRHVRTPAVRSANTAVTAMPPALEADLMAVVGRDRMLRQALERSKRAGNLLLKAERNEAAQVDAFANELIEKEYRAPARPAPCACEREACLHCYHANFEDPLQCAEKVAAFSRCAQQASAAFVG